MNKLLAIIFLGISLSGIASAQTYFNKRETLHSFNSTVFGIIEYNEKYYTASFCFDSVNLINDSGFFWSIGGMRFTKWNKSGSIEFDTLLQRSDSGGVFPNCSAILHLENGTILIPTMAGDTKGHSFIDLTRWDTLGKLYSIMEYDKPFCYTTQLGGNYWGLRDMKQDSSGNWLILSEYQCGIKYVGGYTNIMLSKLDSDFNVLWHRPLDDTFSDHTAGHIIINRDNYIVSGNIRSLQRVHKNFRYQAEIFKTDTGGHVLWHWKSDPKKLTNTAMDIIQTADGGFVYCGMGDGVEIPWKNGTDASIDWYPTIDKIDSLGNPVWHQSFKTTYAADGSDYNNFTTLKQLNNGDIMVAGHIITGYNPADTFSTYGTLVKLDALGNVKWKRQYQYYDSNMIYHIYDMKQTSDGGFIMAGEARDVIWPYTYPMQQAWLLKVDSNGCMSPTDPQCHPTVVKAQHSFIKFAVYPNPAKSILYIRGSVSGHFRLCDVSGRELLQAELPAGKLDELMINYLSAGVYFYTIQTQGGQQRGKLVVE